MTVMEFSMFPLDKGDSLSGWVARVIEIIDRSGLDYKMGPMGTVVEGEWAQLVALLSQCHDALADVSDRVYVSAKFDTRRNATGRIAGKIESVEGKLGRGVKS